MGRGAVKEQHSSRIVLSFLAWSITCMLAPASGSMLASLAALSADHATLLDPLLAGSPGCLVACVLGEGPGVLHHRP